MSSNLIQTGSTGSTGTCWINNLSLVNYDASLYPSQNVLIDYVNISIVFSKFGFRMWNFTFAGNTSLSSFTQIFQFNTKDCDIPCVFGPVTPRGVVFSPKGFKGTLVIDNVTHGISNTENNPFQWAWDSQNAVFELTMDLCGFVGIGSEKEFYVDITIKDASCNSIAQCASVGGNCPNNCSCFVTASICGKTTHPHPCENYLVERCEQCPRFCKGCNRNRNPDAGSHSKYICLTNYAQLI